jgi:hypothetical protein
MSRFPIPCASYQCNSTRRTRPFASRTVATPFSFRQRPGPWALIRNARTLRLGPCAITAVCSIGPRSSNFTRHSRLTPTRQQVQLTPIILQKDTAPAAHAAYHRAEFLARHSANLLPPLAERGSETNNRGPRKAAANAMYRAAKIYHVASSESTGLLTPRPPRFRT